MFILMGLINRTADILTNVSCTCNSKRSTSYQSMAISLFVKEDTMQLLVGIRHYDCIQPCTAQLEFVQILVIVVVMMMMVVVITCLLNHYRLSAQSLLSRHGQAHRRQISLTSDGSLWSSDASGSSSGISEAYAPRSQARVPPYLQREHLGRFQSTYPYLTNAVIELPPNISLSDGEEPPPYQGLCTLQLRDPEQQLELNRESVRAPPNRTIYDSPFSDTSLCPPSVNAGVSATSLECAPPAYSEIIGHYYHPSSLPHHIETPAGAGVVSLSPLIQGHLQSVSG